MCIGNFQFRKNYYDLISCIKKHDKNLNINKITFLKSHNTIDAPLFYNFLSDNLPSDIIIQILNVKKHHLYDLMNESNLFIHCSTSEGFPRSVKEALFNGLPVISSRLDCYQLLNNIPSPWLRQYDIFDLDKLYQLINETSHLKFSNDELKKFNEINFSIKRESEDLKRIYKKLEILN